MAAASAVLDLTEDSVGVAIWSRFADHPAEVSGDQHDFAAHHHAFGIREIQIGPLARGFSRTGPDAPGVLFRAVRYSAALIEIDGDRLTMTALGDRGERFYRETLSAAELTPRV